jgi:predicted NBD/HSP70 family sugar kinase
MLLNLVAEGSAVTRAALAAATGLARSTVSDRVDDLVRREILIEQGTRRSSGGRPAMVLGLNPYAGVILAVDLGATHAQVAVAHFAGGRLAEADEAIDIRDGPEPVLAQVDHHIGHLLKAIGHGVSDVRAVAVGVPGPVEQATGAVDRPPLMNGWDGFNVRTRMADRYKAPTLVDNDVNLMAIGEYRARISEGKHADPLLFVKIGTGIGAGIVSGGQPHRGASGSAGDIGHIRYPGDDLPYCACGKPGCLEAIAGGGALARDLANQGLPARTAREVADLAVSGVPEARRAISIASRQIGEVLGAVVSFYNPALIVIGGPVARDDEVIAGIRGGIFDRALALATKSLRIELSRVGDKAGTAGGIFLAQRHLLSPDGVGLLP